MRGLARQRLPARHARQVDEPLAVLLELIRHVVERVDGPAHFVARRRHGMCTGLQPSRPVATGEIGERRGELLDRPADAVGDQHQRQQRDEPRRTEQDEQRQRESTPQVARIDRVHEAARLSNLGGQLFHADAAQVAAVDLDAGLAAGTVHAPHVVHALAAGARTRRSARAPRSPRTIGRTRATRDAFAAAYVVGRRPARERVLLQRVAFPLVELLRGGLERPGESIELARCRVAQAAVEERRRDPDGCAERQQG